MKISVVIPAYNEERWLGACLRSLRRQDFRGQVEVIVVDNNSTDRTAAVATRLGARVVSEPRRGVCFARQSGTERATGEVIVSTDADTVFPSDWLSRIWKHFQFQADVIAVCGSYEFTNVPAWVRWYTRMLFGTTESIYRRTGELKYLPASNTAFRRTAWPGYNVAMTQGGDEFDFLVRLKNRGRVLFDRQLKVSTSGRRFAPGMFYSIFVAGLWSYVIDYALARRFGKSLTGGYAPIRREKFPTFWRLAINTAAILVIVLVAYTTPIRHARASRLILRAGSRLELLTDRVHFPRHLYWRD